MSKLNIYHRKDSRWEGRILKEKCSDGRRSYYYFFGKSEEEVKTQMTEFLLSNSSDKKCSKTVYQIFSEWYKSIIHKVKESTAAMQCLKQLHL